MLNVISPEAEFLAEALHELGPPQWLSPDYAFDLQLTSEPVAAHAFARETARSVAADINIVACAGRRKRLLAADMESTIIDCECVDELGEIAGVGGRVGEITERAMRGDLPFAAALRERVALLRGLPISALERVYREKVRINPGAVCLVATMRAHGSVTLLVSGGFTFFSERVARDVGFDLQQANTLIDDGARLLGILQEPVLGREAKLQALEREAAKRHIAPRDTIAVGDGANDLDLITQAGLGVAWHAKPVLANAAPAVITHADLTALLYLQGYRDDEIIRNCAD